MVPQGSRVAVFLDRDGTINEDPGYFHDAESLRLLPGAVEAIRRLNRLGLTVVLVTNQSGIARGYFTEADFWRVQRKLDGLLSASGARLDAVYFCPHHPEGKVPPYNTRCRCRKPEPGMLYRAARDLGLDLGWSYMVGDRETDIQAGRAAGCRTVWLREATGESGVVARSGQMEADWVARTLEDAVRWIVQDLNRRGYRYSDEVQAWRDDGSPEKV